MPKVNKKDSNALLQEVQAVPMDAENLIEDPVQPDKPQFAPLSAYEQNGKKIEFRRVRLYVTRNLSALTAAL